MFWSVAQGDTDPIDPRQRHRGRGAWPKGKMAALEGGAFFSLIIKLIVALIVIYGTMSPAHCSNNEPKCPHC